MEKTEKKTRNWIITLLVGVLIVLAGIFILVRKDIFLTVVIVVVGAGMLIDGVRSLLLVHRSSFSTYVKAITLVKGFAGIVIGLVAIFYPIFAANLAWTILFWIIGIQMIITAFVSFSDAFILRKNGVDVTSLLIEGILSIIIAVLLIIFSQQLQSFIITVIGVLVIILGVCVSGWAFRLRAVLKKVDEYRNQHATSVATYEIIETGDEAEALDKEPEGK